MKKLIFLVLFSYMAVGQTKFDKQNASRLFDLSFTSQELDKLYSDVLDNVVNYKAMHGLSLGNEVPLSLWQNPRLPRQYKHRHYPDITHTVRCQYPTENWDQAFALTEGRGVSNPQPRVKF